jgi:hypothetical protein
MISYAFEYWYKSTSGDHDKEIILLTEDCFKLLCMRSNNKKAEKIRYYYLTLEKLVEIYKDEIIKKQNY